MLKKIIDIIDRYKEPEIDPCPDCKKQKIIDWIFGKEISEKELALEILASGCVMEKEYCLLLAKELLKTLEIKKKNNY